MATYLKMNQLANGQRQGKKFEFPIRSSFFGDFS